MDEICGSLEKDGFNNSMRRVTRGYEKEILSANSGNYVKMRDKSVNNYNIIFPLKKSSKNIVEKTKSMDKKNGKKISLRGGKIKQQKTAVKERNLICDFCKKTYAKKCILESHVLLHLGVRPFQCTFCPKNFTQRCTLMEHIRIHTKERPYKCDICSRTFMVYSSWHIHKKSHQEPTIQCEFCDRKFRSKGELKSHVNCRHNDSRPIKCKQCPAAFKVHAGLNAHIKYAHEAVKDSEMCESCGKHFKCKINLKSHIRLVHVEPKFPCNHCTMLFKTKPALEMHQLCFLNEALAKKFEGRSKLYPFPCVYCDEIFNCEESRKNHSNLIHAKTFPYICEVCPFRFKIKLHLKQHLIRFHSPAIEKEPSICYPCPNCGKILKGKRHLKQHLNSISCKNKNFKPDLDSLVQVFDTDCEFVDFTAIKK